MKKCCYTCEYYYPSFFGVYKGEICDGICDYDDCCVSSSDYCCSHYLQISPPLLISPCSDLDGSDLDGSDLDGSDLDGSDLDGVSF